MLHTVLLEGRYRYEHLYMPVHASYEIPTGQPLIPGYPATCVPIAPVAI
jgi:hypothetical protein